MKKKELTEEEKEQQRTKAQNRSLHLWCKMTAEFLNDSGLDQRKALAPEIEIPWDTMSVKEKLWKPVQKEQLEKESTADMNTKEPTKVRDTLNRHFSEIFGESLPEWPSKERQKEEEMANKYN